jgi:hypothetical protein
MTKHQKHRNEADRSKDIGRDGNTLVPWQNPVTMVSSSKKKKAHH